MKPRWLLMVVFLASCGEDETPLGPGTDADIAQPYDATCVLDVAVDSSLGTSDDIVPETWADADTLSDVQDLLDVPTWTCAPGEKCDQPFCEQVLIPSGTFVMGSNEEHILWNTGGLFENGNHQPAHLVQLGTFCIDKYEATGQRYRDCVMAGGCPWDYPRGQGGSFVGVLVNHYPPSCQDDVTKCPHYAVNCRSWQQAHQYCTWIGRRLCTEAEWERAASGPGLDKPKYPWGDDTIKPLHLNDWTFMDTGEVAPVAAFWGGQSAEGVFQLAGNVFEWVADYYAEYEVEDPDAPIVAPMGAGYGERKVGRGGCAFAEGHYATYERAGFHPQFDYG